MERNDTVAALRAMKQMPGFQQSLQKVVHREVQIEVEAAAKLTKDQPLNKYSREDVESFEPVKLYDRQRQRAPLLMSVLGAASSPQKLKDLDASLGSSEIPVILVLQTTGFLVFHISGKL